MIVSTIKEMNSHLISLNLIADGEGDRRFDSFLAREQEWLTEHILGNDIEEILETEVASGQTDPHKRLRDLACRVISQRAYLASVPESDLQRSEAGFVVQMNDKMSPASQQRVDRLVESLNERIDTDCDALVRHLLNESAADKPYQDWRGTRQFSYLTEAFIPTMAVMRQNSRLCPVSHWQEFYDLIPRMVSALRGTVADYISIEEVEILLELYRDQELLDVHKKVLRLVRMSVMAAVEGLPDNAVHYAIQARSWMMRHESDFTAFVESDRYNLPKPFNLGDGTVANLL